MSTSACFTFCDSTEPWTSFHVFKRLDGYPYARGHTGKATGGLVWIRNAFQYAWELPRYEAPDFAAAFVAANKRQEGDIQLINHETPWTSHRGCVYQYICGPTREMNDLFVEVLDVAWSNKTPQINDEVMEGNLHDLINEQRRKPQVA